MCSVPIDKLREAHEFATIFTQDLYRFEEGEEEPNGEIHQYTLQQLQSTIETYKSLVNLGMSKFQAAKMTGAENEWLEYIAHIENIEYVENAG